MKGKMMKKKTPLGQRIREAREAAGLTRRAVVEAVPELKGEMDLYHLETGGKHVASHELVAAVMARLGMPSGSTNSKSDITFAPCRARTGTRAGKS